jgi:hypothetical protein
MRSCEVFDAFTDLDHVGEHTLDTTDPRDQVARSGWVGFRQQICPYLFVGSDRVALDDEADGWSVWNSPALSRSRCRRYWRGCLPCSPGS